MHNMFSTLFSNEKKLNRPILHLHVFAQIAYDTSEKSLYRQKPQTIGYIFAADSIGLCRMCISVYVLL